MRKTTFVIGVALATATTALPPSPAEADDAANLPPARYTFNRVADGFVRLDNQTGQVAHCNQRAAGWACQALPEDRMALEQEITRLQNQVASLQKEIARLRAPRPPRPPKEVPDESESKLKLPTQPNTSRARAFIEEAWRQLMNMLVNLQKDVMRKS